MNLSQTAKNNMYKAVLAFFSANGAYFDNFPRAKTQIELFGTQNQMLDNYIAQQAGSSKGATGEKGALFATMIALTVKASRKALVYARDKNAGSLAQLLDVQVHDFNNMPGKTALAHVENIYKALQPLNGQLIDYRVTDSDVTAIANAIKAYEAASGTPQNARALSEAGTKGIESTIPAIDKSLDILDNLIVHGMDDNPGLVNAYRNVRRIHETGTRHTGLVAAISDEAGNGIEGATMLVQELNKQAVSDALGSAIIESMKPGTYHILFSADGYASQTRILKIEQGKTIDEVVKMERVAI